MYSYDENYSINLHFTDAVSLVQSSERDIWKLMGRINPVKKHFCNRISPKIKKEDFILLLKAVTGTGFHEENNESIDVAATDIS